MTPLVPPAHAWIKARRSYSTGACVEVAPAGDFIAVRDSKSPELNLFYTPSEFSAFLDGAKNGEFDHLVE